MRITFLTGSLEQGKDGVGDYTRLLAHECASRGAAAQVVALADRHTERPRTDSSGPVEVVRLPYGMRWPSRLASAEATIRRWSPRWVSLQFVPYSFQRWGITTSLVNALPQLTGPAKLQAMLHEIWAGGVSWPQKMIGIGQRQCLLRLCRHRATVVHTSNETYQRMLAEHAVSARLLPLFGSLPIADTNADAWLPSALARVGGADVAIARQKWWLLTIFGTLHPAWRPEPLMRRLQAVATESGKRLALISVGRLGPGESLWQDMQSRYGHHVSMLRLGEQPETRISQLLNSVDFGVSTSPYTLVGKSATMAAMMEHGVPVIVTREDGPPGGRPPLDQDACIRLDDRFGARLIGARRRPRRRRLSEIADRFLKDLASVEGAG